MYIIAGCNGAGKTTASFTVLPEMLNCKVFLNADEIARGISPFKPEKAAIEAGKIMLNHVEQSMSEKVDFAVETTLSGKIHYKFIRDATRLNYRSVLLFFWLSSADMAKQRVLRRVLAGGHNIPPDIIERRYISGLRNFFNLYSGKVSEWYFIDNSSVNFKLMAWSANGIIEIDDDEKWNKLKSLYCNETGK